MKAPGYSATVTKMAAAQRSAPRYIANFDSAAAMLRSLGRLLRGKEFSRVAMLPPVADALGPIVNNLPRKAKEFIYTYSGWGEAIPANRISEINAEAVSAWVVNEYPRRPYPAIAVGSSNGALTHLWAALGIPWLPQTFLFPVRHHGIHPDEPAEGMEWGKGPAKELLDANPELKLHHMHDANQDRLMIQRMTYFRAKQLRLGETYERFIEENLEPGGTIFLVECELSWPVTRINERHVFQSGALGGATADEFLYGSERVEEYLQRYGSHRTRWASPEPNDEQPEAEWGFEPALGEDVRRFAREHGYKVKRVVFKYPEDPSSLVADLYRWWNRQRGLLANRLLVSSFMVMEPYWTFRTGSAPFWMVFNMETSLRGLHDYLDRVEPYDYIHMMLFSHGVECVGLPSIEEWRAVLGRARREGSFIGVDEDAFPMDFAVFVRYQKDLKKKIRSRYPLPAPLRMDQLDAFLEAHGDGYPVTWMDADALDQRQVA